MKRFLIIVTILEGEQTGESYLLEKGGKIADNAQTQTAATTYAHRKNVEKQCRELQYNNDITRGIERNAESDRVRRGFKPTEQFKFYSKSFRPYAIEI